jgi:hypothetical protein
MKVNSIVKMRTTNLSSEGEPSRGGREETKNITTTES